MNEPARRHFSFRDYVRLEEYSNVRHEFLDGVIYAMAGGTPEHAALAARIIGALRVQLAGRGCEVFTSDLRVRVAATGLATYPDVSVVCGTLQTDPEDRSSVLNPVLLVEVSSESTAEYDRGEKLEHYRQIPSLREVLIVSHRAAEVDVWRYEDGSWSSRRFHDGERVRLASIDGELSIDELYESLPTSSDAAG